jgi:hypothetical protein
LYSALNRERLAKTVSARFHAVRVMRVMCEINESETVVTIKLFKMSPYQREQKHEAQCA